MENKATPIQLHTKGVHSYLGNQDIEKAIYWYSWANLAHKLKMSQHKAAHDEVKLAGLLQSINTFKLPDGFLGAKQVLTYHDGSEAEFDSATLKAFLNLQIIVKEGEEKEEAVEKERKKMWALIYTELGLDSSIDWEFNVAHHSVEVDKSPACLSDTLKKILSR